MDTVQLSNKSSTIGDEYSKLGVFDIDGILRGKYIHNNKLASGLEHGFSFCDVIMGWDSQDVLYDKSQLTGWHTGYPDAQIISTGSPRLIPDEQVPLYLCEFDTPFDEICPRQILKRVLKHAEKMGFRVKTGFEYEFFIFNETAESVRLKNYQNMQPFTQGNCGYSVLRNSIESDFHLGLLNYCKELGISLEGLHCETGPGVLEAAITYSDALTSADNAALFKTFTKVYTEKQQKLATFMARWSTEQAGQSGHMHCSLTDLEGNPVFYDVKQDKQISSTLRHFVAGQQLLMPEFLSMIAPTVNSYTRLVPGFWAPTAASIGIDNRTAALRIIPGQKKAQRVEYRVSGSDANPYLALSAAIASGLWGIANKAEPLISSGNIYEAQLPSEYELPNTLASAADRLANSDIAKDYLGETFVEHFVETRRFEIQQHQKAVTDWQLQRYFEFI